MNQNRLPPSSPSRTLPGACQEAKIAQFDLIHRGAGITFGESVGAILSRRQTACLVTYHIVLGSINERPQADVRLTASNHASPESHGWVLVRSLVVGYFDIAHYPARCLH